MAKILGNLVLSFSGIAGHTEPHDDDAIDQLNHFATTGLLLALALGTGVKQYVGDPIRCWIPAEYKNSEYQKYADNYCWIHPMYNVPSTQLIPADEDDRWDTDISFYRWVTVVFLLQALLFKLPNLLWHELKCYSGLNLEKIVNMTMSAALLPEGKREEKMAHIAVFTNKWLVTYTHYKYNFLTRFRERFSSVFFCLGKRTGTYLTGLYMLMKILYCANTVGQFFLLSSFLDLNYWDFGIKALNDLFKKGRWKDDTTFPRIGLCDYKIRQMANVQPFSVQCVLAVNLFLEKMYLLLWFWLIILLVANIVSLVAWFINDIMSGRSEQFMDKYARFIGIKSDRDKTLYKLFIFNYLRSDGIFVLRILAKNAGELLTIDLVKQLWITFYKQLEKRDQRKGVPSAPLEYDEAAEPLHN